MSDDKNPTPENQVFNHDADYLHDAAGIGTKEELQQRIDKLNHKIHQEEVTSLSVISEMVCEEFTKKELAVLWTVEITDNPMTQLMEQLSRSVIAQA